MLFPPLFDAWQYPPKNGRLLICQKDDMYSQFNYIILFFFQYGHMNLPRLKNNTVGFRVKYQNLHWNWPLLIMMWLITISQSEWNEKFNYKKSGFKILVILQQMPTKKMQSTNSPWTMTKVEGSFSVLLKHVCMWEKPEFQFFSGCL
jgi:hypothetical protein